MDIGDENYARYYYLWHLIAIGVVIPGSTDGVGPEDCPPIGSTLWDDLPTEEVPKIGLIDMGVAPHHPNLEAPNGHQGKIDWDNALDLASHRYGVKYVALDDLAPAQRHIEPRTRHLGGIVDGSAITGLTAQERAIVDRIKQGAGVVRAVDVYDDSYAGHGTGCAGLTSGTSFDEDQFGEIGNIAVYYGVDPCSQVVPITTSISPDPGQLIAAFLYALSLDVDVILFPRDGADPRHWPRFGDLDLDENTRLHKTADPPTPGDPGDIDTEWATLEKVIDWVSVQIPVVCAAGNDGRSDLIYPAKLAVNSSNGVIAVGAVSYLGYRSGYSNYGPGLTVVAPSDDGEVYNRHQLRLDRQAASASDFWVEDVHLRNQPPYYTFPKIPVIRFASQRLISLDVPGPRGYVEGPRAGPVASRAEAKNDPSGLYAEFGGTSGAAALVAGVISLMQRKARSVGGAKLNGETIKDKFEALSGDADKLNVDQWYWLDNGVDTLRRDAINGDTLPSDEDLFGQAGLLNASKLLASV